jgi:dolichol-phosphate mannosyltransferase
MRYLVAIPVFNEAATLEGVIREVRGHADDVLVINDGSTDATPGLLRRMPCVHKIHHAYNHGYGRSLIDAFDFAIRCGYDWLITIDCDEQHEPVRIPDFVAAARTDHADIISGSRYLRQFNGNGLPPADRRAINERITDLLRETLGLQITDAFCGFKAYRVDALRRLRITVPGYGMPLQLWVQASHFGLRIRELPVRLIYNDPNRHFGGDLDDPDARLIYYYDVLIHEMGSLLRPRSEEIRLKGKQPSAAPGMSQPMRSSC